MSGVWCLVSGVWCHIADYQDSAGNVQYPTVVFIIEMIDNFVVIFFTIEFVIRLLVCPNKIRSFDM